MFKKLADNELAEATVLDTYLPKQLAGLAEGRVISAIVKNFWHEQVYAAGH